MCSTASGHNLSFDVQNDHARSEQAQELNETWRDWNVHQISRQRPSYYHTKLQLHLEQLKLQNNVRLSNRIANSTQLTISKHLTLVQMGLKLNSECMLCCSFFTLAECACHRGERG